MSKTTALYVHHAYFFDVHRATTSLNLPMRRFMEDMDRLRQITPSLFEHGSSR